MLRQNKDSRPIFSDKVWYHMVENGKKLLKLGYEESINKPNLFYKILTSNHGNNGIITTPADVGGWPELKSSAAPADSDHDGMPNEWELRYGLNPDDSSDGNEDANGDGYTNLEHYLAQLAGELTDTSPVMIKKK